MDSSNACSQASAPILCTPLHGPVQFAIHRGVRLLGHMFSPKLSISLRRSSPPRNTLFLGPSPLTITNDIPIGSAVFVWVPCSAVHRIVSGEENPQNCLFPLGFRHPAGGRPCYGHRQNAQKLIKIAHVVPEISSRTDRHTKTCLSQYFAIAPTG